MNQEILDFLAKDGWTNLGPQKMSSMASFTRKNWRMNWYTTTNTVTFQDMRFQYFKPIIYREVDLNKLKVIIGQLDMRIV